MDHESLVRSPLVERAWTVHIRWIEPLLGSQPTSDLARDVVERKQLQKLIDELQASGMSAPAARAAAVQRLAAETARKRADDGEEDEEDELRITVFPADARGLHLWDYQFKGMLKAAAKATGARVAGRKAATTASAASEIQTKLWVFSSTGDRVIPLTRDGKRIAAADDLLSRPIRAETPRGPVVTVTTSEVLYPPIEADLLVLGIRGGRITRDILTELLSFGAFEGMGQWRSSGLGRFLAEVTPVKG